MYAEVPTVSTIPLKSTKSFTDLSPLHSLLLEETLQDRSSDIQVILARFDCLVPQGGFEKRDVSSLMLRDLFEATASPGGKTGLDEIFMTELLETLRVEGILEVLECEREVEDFHVYIPVNVSLQQQAAKWKTAYRSWGLDRVWREEQRLGRRRCRGQRRWRRASSWNGRGWVAVAQESGKRVKNVGVGKKTEEMNGRRR